MTPLLIVLEAAVVVLAMLLLLVDLWTPHEQKPKLGYVAAAGLVVILALTFMTGIGGQSQLAFQNVFVQDGLAVFFDRLFLVAAILVILMAVEFADRIRSGIAE